MSGDILIRHMDLHDSHLRRATSRFCRISSCAQAAPWQSKGIVSVIAGILRVESDRNGH